MLMLFPSMSLTVVVSVTVSPALAVTSDTPSTAWLLTTGIVTVAVAGWYEVLEGINSTVTSKSPIVVGVYANVVVLHV